MHRRALLTGLALAPSAQGWAASPGGAVASFSVLADITRRVSGGLITVVSLVPPDADSHVYQPTAADSRTLASAVLLVENGLGLEGWIARLGTASGFRGIKVIATTGVTPRLMREGAATSTDPHAWQNPRHGILYARNIAEGLATADPDHAEAYRANAVRFVAEIEKLDAWISAQFAPIPQAARRIVTTHDAFGYYGDRYGIDFLAAEGIATDAEPSAKAIAALVAQIRREKVRTVFLENMTDPRLAKMLARETGATLSGPLYSDSLSKPGGPAPDYLAMLRHNTSLFARAMAPG
ncbi:MAG: metal ABC transporter substrate-binding protein [Acetobacteraceae bacterium]|nr:metal ABC transporter substrate-binding protein [Acetobacteraceae bacterium]